MTVAIISSVSTTQTAMMVGYWDWAATSGETCFTQPMVVVMV